VNLNISMAIYDAILFVRQIVYMNKNGGSCADRVKDVDRHLFFDKVKSLGIDSCLYEIPKNDLVDDMKLCHRSRSPMYRPTVTSSKLRETSLGKS